MLRLQPSKHERGLPPHVLVPYRNVVSIDSSTREANLLNLQGIMKCVDTTRSVLTLKIAGTLLGKIRPRCIFALVSPWHSSMACTLQCVSLNTGY